MRGVGESEEKKEKKDKLMGIDNIVRVMGGKRVAEVEECMRE